MKSSLPETDQLVNEDLGLKLLDSHNYWAKKRLLFNILVGVAGLLSIFFFAFGLSAFDFLGILMWGLVANGLYSFGYALESLVIVKTNGGSKIKKYRSLVFWLGTIAYVLVSIVFAFGYFTTQLP